MQSRLRNLGYGRRYANEKMKRVQVQYFAVFREQKGLSHETVETNAATLCELYDELGLRLPRHLVRASLNLAFEPLESKIADGDQIVFIPPVAGG